jgi:hypothetical protein
MHFGLKLRGVGLNEGWHRQRESLTFCESTDIGAGYQGRWVKIPFSWSVWVSFIGNFRANCGVMFL